jgi:FlaG/FlaF family flagellin (archaellin)
MKTKNFYRRFRRSVRAVSPVIAVLLMIVIAVAAALFAYSWTMGYLDFLTIKADQGVQIQAINWDGTTLTAYAQNVGESPVTLVNVYIDDVLDPAATITTPDLDPGATTEITSLLYTGADPQVTVKVSTADGNIFMLKKTVTTNTGGTTTPTYLYYKPITLGTVTGGPLSNFPVLVSITGDSDIAARATTGDQIYFTDDVGTLIPHELIAYSAGSLSAWVSVPNLNTGTVVRIYYGTTRPSYTPAAVWNTNYKGVWHLEEAGTGAADEYIDSTSNNNDGQGGNGAPTDTPVRVSGKIGYAQDFVSNDFINVGTGNSLKIQDTLTVEAWVKMDANAFGCVVCRQLGTGTGDAYTMFENTGPTASFYISGISSTASSSTITTNPYTAFHHWVVTVTTGTNNVRIYVDGQLSGTQRTLSTYPTLDDNPVIFGAGENDGTSNPNEWFNGAIDEVRISNIVRSPGWITTEYANMNDPAGFIGLGSEVQETV